MARSELDKLRETEQLMDTITSDAFKRMDAGRAWDARREGRAGQ